MKRQWETEVRREGFSATPSSAVNTSERSILTGQARASGSERELFFLSSVSQLISTENVYRYKQRWLDTSVPHYDEHVFSLSECEPILFWYDVRIWPKSVWRWFSSLYSTGLGLGLCGDSINKTVNFLFFIHYFQSNLDRYCSTPPPLHGILTSISHTIYNHHVINVKR